MQCLLAMKFLGGVFDTQLLRLPRDSRAGHARMAGLTLCQHDEQEAAAPYLFSYLSRWALQRVCPERCAGMQVLQRRCSSAELALLRIHGRRSCMLDVGRCEPQSQTYFHEKSLQSGYYASAWFNQVGYQALVKMPANALHVCFALHALENNCCQLPPRLLRGPLPCMKQGVQPRPKTKYCRMWATAALRAQPNAL